MKICPTDSRHVYFNRVNGELFCSQCGAQPVAREPVGVVASGGPVEDKAIWPPENKRLRGRPKKR